MRFVLISTHIDQTTGYSKVSHNLVRQISTLSPKIQTFHFGFQRHPKRESLRKYPDGVKSYDAAANEDPREEGFGFNKIHEYIETVNPDVVMIYNDPHIVSRFIESMKHERGKSQYKLWVYLDQVYTGIAQPLISTLHTHADRIYCFSDTWKKTFLEYGEFSDVRVLEHAVDPVVFSCLSDETKNNLRANLGIPSDSIVMLNVNRNSQRKRLDATISGFVGLVAKNQSKPYYLAIASNLQPQTGAYYDIQRIFTQELKDAGLQFQVFGRRLLLIDTSGPNMWTDDGINQLYNAAQIGINTSDGEGFGLCQLEHMYTGAPQIVTDIGTYRTFLDTDVAEFIPSNGRGYFAGGMPHGFSFPTFANADVTAAMERTIDALPSKEKAIQSYKFTSWTRVCDGWLEDLLREAEGPSSIVSVPETSSVLV